MKTLFIARQTNLFEQFANPQFKISEDYQIIDQVLENEEIILELSKDFPDVSTGRNRTPSEQILRFLILKHQRGLSYRDLERTLKVNLEDRWFCKIAENAPCFKTVQNQLVCINEKTIKAINDRVMREAIKLKLTRGKKMRVDSTVTEANIHYPTDAGLIADSIRVITKNLAKFKIIPRGYRNFKRKIRQQLNIIRTIGRRNKETRQQAIRKIIKMGKTVARKIKQTKKKIIKKHRKILEKIIEQSEQALAGEKIQDRIVSIFEPAARPIPKGKADKKCEFGQETQIQEDEHFITNWQINNKTSDKKFFPQALKKHKQIFQKPPNETATDRGYWSPKNNKIARKEIKHVSIPKKGRLNQQEKQHQSTAKFKQLQRWRAGGEAKISLLKRRYRLDQCRYKGNDGMARWVGGGILACNLMTMARLLSS